MIVTCLSCDHDEQHQEVKQNEVCQEKELSPWCSTQESGQNNAAMGKDKEDWANSFSTNTACNLEVDAIAFPQILHVILKLLSW